MNVVFIWGDDADGGEEPVSMEAVPRVGDFVQLDRRLWRVEKVEWSVTEKTDHGISIPPRAYVYIVADDNETEEA